MTSHETLLPYYMTLSSNPWSILGALRSTFLNPTIPCNLVDAWLNPALALIEPIRRKGDDTHLLNGLTARQPRLGSLWLGATINGVRGFLLDVLRGGDLAVSLEAEAWMGVNTTFLTMKMNPDCYDKDADTINKEDECKLLFLHNHTHHNHGHLPVWSWKPFGKTKICDTEAELRGHLECGCHVLKYEGYNWELEDGSVIKDTGLDTCLSSSLEFRAPEFVSLTVSGCLSCEPAAVPAEPVGLPLYQMTWGLTCTPSTCLGIPLVEFTAISDGMDVQPARRRYISILGLMSGVIVMKKRWMRRDLIEGR
ncbi:uncharacterized protein N7446_007828 [Penicillium canescens]|uniref:uncharacterized protein n=1 Tax=Penicillium canescens TaxID=5083 RepID=UPI0026E00FEB|nr:uncharacterized protein N7446_007828 [Penicillium canescens]KAJ6033875.1 hypothetical protein N7444_011646 [Penicillium canescens]KAJ6058245.1 hypothetical protein N7446_007828 [Penicillium canescens]